MKLVLKRETVMAQRPLISEEKTKVNHLSFNFRKLQKEEELNLKKGKKENEN